MRDVGAYFPHEMRYALAVYEYGDLFVQFLGEIESAC